MSIFVSGILIYDWSVTKTTTYTITNSDYTILCDASSAGFTVTLPTASGITGKIFKIKKTDATGNDVTVEGNASETIDGQLNKILNAQYMSITVQSNGTSWYII